MPLTVKTKLSADAGNTLKFGTDSGLYGAGGGGGAFVVASATSYNTTGATITGGTETFLHGVNVAMTAGRTYQFGYAYTQTPTTTSGTYSQGRIRLILGAGSTTTGDGTVVDTVQRTIPAIANIGLTEKGLTPPYTCSATGTYTVKICALMTGTAWQDGATSANQRALVAYDITDLSTNATTPPATPGAYIAGPGTAITTYGANNNITAGNGMTATGTDVVDGSETKLVAGSNIAVTGGGTAASPYVVSSAVGVVGGGHISAIPVETGGQYVYNQPGVPVSTVVTPAIGQTVFTPFSVSANCVLNSVYLSMVQASGPATTTVYLYRYRGSGTASIVGYFNGPGTNAAQLYTFIASTAIPLTAGVMYLVGFSQGGSANGWYGRSGGNVPPIYTTPANFTSYSSYYFSSGAYGYVVNGTQTAADLTGLAPSTMAVNFAYNITA